MVSRCCVPRCRNNGTIKGISFHNFTKDPKLRNVWMEKINQDTQRETSNPKPFNINQYTKICSQHFIRQDFIIRSERNILKPHAVPSLFPPIIAPEHIVTEVKKNTYLVVDIANYMQPGTSSDNRTFEECQLESLNDPLLLEEEIKTEEVKMEQDDEIPGLLYPENNDSYYTKPQDKDEEHKNAKQKLLKAYEDLIREHNEYVNVCNCHIKKNDKTTKRRYQPLFKNITYTKKARFSLGMFNDEDNEISYYTGFPSYDFLMISFETLLKYKNDDSMKTHYNNILNRQSRHHSLKIEDEYFLVLLKLRQNYEDHHLSTLFNVHCSTISNVFRLWINFMYAILGSLNIWPHREVLLSHYTQEFKEKHPNFIGSLHAIEIHLQKVTSSTQQSELFSQYKNSNMVKGLVVADGNGAIIFVSSLFTGAISDSLLLQQSGFTEVVREKLKSGFVLPGDSFFANKGFTITELLNPPVELTVPVFKINPMQFLEVEIQHEVALERVHIERAISRVKLFKILASEVPLSLIGTFSRVWTVCCLLCNFQMPEKDWE